MNLTNVKDNKKKINNNFDIKRIIYYLILIFIACIGSMLGINKKIDNK